MKIAIVRERTDGETRVAATPETVTRFIALGNTVAVEAGAGAAARFTDESYRAAGAEIVPAAAAAIKGAGIVLTVRRPEAGLLAGAEATDRHRFMTARERRSLRRSRGTGPLSLEETS